MFIEIRKTKRLQKAGTRTCHAKQWPTPPSKIDWRGKRWKRNLYSPPELQQQIDDWACVLFLMMGMKILTKRSGFDGVKEDAKDEMRLEALEALLNLP